LQQRYSELDVRLKPLTDASKEINSLKSQATTLNKETKKSSNRLGSQSPQWRDDNANQIAKKHEDLIKSLDNIDRRISDTLANTNESLDEILPQITEAAENFNNLLDLKSPSFFEETLPKLLAKRQELEQQLTQLDEILKVDADGLTSRSNKYVEDIESTVNIIYDRQKVESLNARRTEIEGAIAKLNSELDSLDTEYGDVAGDIIRKRRQELNALSLDPSLDSKRQEILEAARGRNRGVGDRLASLQTKAQNAKDAIKARIELVKGEIDQLPNSKDVLDEQTKVRYDASVKLRRLPKQIKANGKTGKDYLREASRNINDRLNRS